MRNCPFRTVMSLREIATVAGILALSGCAATPDAIDAQYAAHASRYSDERQRALQDFAAGVIAQEAFSTRLEAASLELARADAETGRAELAATEAARTPAAEPQNACFLISCGATRLQPQPAPESKPRESPQPSPAADKPRQNGCFLIPC